MKNFNILFFYLFTLVSAFSNSKISQFEVEIKVKQNVILSLAQEINLTNDKIKRVSSEVLLFQGYQNPKFKMTKVSVLKSKIISKIPSTKFTRKKIYKCLLSAISELESISICSSSVRVTLPYEWTKLVNLYENHLILSDSEFNKSINKKLRTIDYLKKKIVITGKKITNAQNSIDNINISINQKIKEELWQQTKAANAQFYRCDKNTPTVNLENEFIYEGSTVPGPYFNTIVDDQKDLGSCYANTAKNILFAASEGAVNASFLDMALQTHRVMVEEQRLFGKELDVMTLDGGTVCASINAIQKVGYCPQKYGLFEGKNQSNYITYSDGFKAPLEQGQILNRYTYFLKGFKSLKSNNNKAFLEYSDKLKSFVPFLEKYKDAILPAPEPKKIPLSGVIASKLFPGSYKNEDSYKRKNALLSDINKKWGTYKVRYGDLTLNKVDVESVYEDIKYEWSPIFNDHGFSSFFIEYRDYIINRIKGSLSSEKYLISLKATSQLKKDLQNNLDYSLDITSTEEHQFAKMLENLRKLIKYLDMAKLDLVLFDDDGLIREDNVEVFQLAVAPHCNSSSQRLQVPKTFKCQEHYNLNKNTDQFREFVMKQFLKPIPQSVANIQPGHANTIVGYRFNKNSNKCQYAIRESQIGRTGWVDEDKVMQLNQGLTVIESEITDEHVLNIYK